MTDIFNKEFLIEVANGHVPGYRIVNKFGYNANIGASFAPITSSGTYQTPMADTELEIVSDSVNDAPSGTGMLTAQVDGIDFAGNKLEIPVTLNGATPVILSDEFFRAYRITSTGSGSYAGSTAPSHSSTITVQTSGGGAIWGEVSVDGAFGLSQSQIAAFTVEAGHTASILSAGAFVNASKEVDMYFFRRSGANIVTAPYSPMKLLQEYHGVGGSVSMMPPAPVNDLTEFTDVGIMCKIASGTAGVTATFQLLVIDNNYL